MGLSLALGRVMIKKEIKNSLVIINRARRMENGPDITQMEKKNMKACMNLAFKRESGLITTLLEIKI